MHVHGPSLICSAFVHRHDHERLPVVVIETALDAVSMSCFSFPQHCDIMVGSEDLGVSDDVLSVRRCVATHGNFFCGTEAET